MNIFVLSRNVRTCAQLHCDQHVVKMPLETAQLLSTALFTADAARWAELHAAGLAYKPTHLNHPCAVWARACINNYLWLARLGLELCAEYEFRFGVRAADTPKTKGRAPLPAREVNENGPAREPAPAIKVHKSQPVLAALRAAMPPLPRERIITPFSIVVPDDCLVPGDPVSSYRCCYVQHKARFARWTRRPVPDWFDVPTPG